MMAKFIHYKTEFYKPQEEGLFIGHHL